MALFGDNLSKEEREQKRIKETIEKYNIFNGIQCEITLPEKQLKTSGSSGKKKGIATLAFGVIGWAATSGTSQNEENRIITTIFHVVKKGIVFKNGNMDGSDIRIPYNEIIKMEVVTPDRAADCAIITLLNNKRIIIDPNQGFEKNKIILNHAMDFINERACGSQYEESGWGLEYGTAEPKKTKQETISLIDELERLGNMYDKGLLSDEEFTSLKQELLSSNTEEPTTSSEVDVGTSEENIDNSENICKNCGTEVSPDSAFCSECGTKINDN